MVGSPFLGDLSMRVEKLIADPVPWWQQLGPTIMRELRKLRYHLPRLVLLIVCSIIPLLNTFAPLLWLGFGAWMMAVQYCDYPFDNHKVPFKPMRAKLADHKAHSFSFGIMVSVFAMIPIVNFLVMPVAICGATAMWVDDFKDEMVGTG